jgi:hypothetical protein
LILGVNAALIPESPVPAGTIRAMVEGSCAYVEAVLEEFNVKGKAIYLPPRDGRVIAYVPTKQGASSAYRAMEAPVRVVAEVEGEPACASQCRGEDIAQGTIPVQGSTIGDVDPKPETPTDTQEQSETPISNHQQQHPETEPDTEPETGSETQTQTPPQRRTELLPATQAQSRSHISARESGISG